MLQLSPATACKFEVREDLFVCVNCGLKVPTKLFGKGKPFVACRSAVEASAALPVPVAPEQQPRGLGDMVADGLSAVGITKERASALAKAVGVKDCGCKARQAAMNSFGAKYLGIGASKPAQPKSDVDSV